MKTLDNATRSELIAALVDKHNARTLGPTSTDQVIVVVIQLDDNDPGLPTKESE